MASRVGPGRMCDPLQMGCLVQEIQTDDLVRRSVSGTSTDVSSDGHPMMSAPTSCTTSCSHESQTSSEVEVDHVVPKLVDGQESASKEPAPEDIGGLLLQAFKIRDDYFQLQKRHASLKATAREEVGGLKTELRSARDEICMLKAQLATMHATTGSLQAQLAMAPKMVDDVLDVSARSANRNLRAACFEAWTCFAQRKACSRTGSKSSACPSVEDFVSAARGAGAALTAPADEVLIVTTGVSAGATRPAPREGPSRYQSLRSPESATRGPSRNTTAQNTPGCSPLASPMCSPGPQPVRAAHISGPALFSFSPEQPQPMPLPTLFSSLPEVMPSTALAPAPAPPSSLAAALFGGTPEKKVDVRWLTPGQSPPPAPWIAC